MHMTSSWPSVSYEEWSDTCDTLHAHTQVLGKLAAQLAPPEPQLQHAALRLTARGWETLPLPAPDGSGALVVALDLHTHEAVAEHSDGRVRSVALTPDRSVGSVTREVLDAIGELVGSVEVDLTPQEAPWSTPLDEDEEHARYDPARVASYFAAATRAALPAEPPADDFVMRNAMDSQEVAVGWWPGDPKHGKAAFYANAHPAPDSFSDGVVSPAAARWDATQGLYLLDWDDVRTSADPHAFALEFARSVFDHACAVCDWDPTLAASAAGTPPPVV
jgi:hypothetical protein